MEPEKKRTGYTNMTLLMQTQIQFATVYKRVLM